MRFNLEFIIALLVSLLSVYLVTKGSPNLSPYISFLLVPLLVAYIMVLIINNIFPWINEFGYNTSSYVLNKTYGKINDTNYLQIYPSILFVLIVFTLLLYNGFLN